MLQCNGRYCMSLTTTIAHNTLLQVIGKGFSVLFGVMSVALLTRYLGTAGYGSYITAITFVQLFGILADLGLYMVSVKKISEPGADVDRLFSNFFTLRLFSVLCFVLAAPLVVLLFPYPTEVRLGVAAVSLMNLFMMLSQLLTGLFQKSLAMGIVAVSEVAGKSVMLILLYFLLRAHASLPMLLAVSVIGNAAQFFILFGRARRMVRLRLRFEWPVWRVLLKESWPIAVTIALNLVYFRADTILLTLFRSAETVGIYGASYKVLEVLIAFPAMFAGLMTPLLAEQFSCNDRARFRVILQRAFDFLLLVALPIVGGTLIVANKLMVLISGPAFAASGDVLRVLIFATGSIFVGMLFGNTIVAVGAQRRMIGVYAVVAVASLAGYLLLIPAFGMWGAAGMTLATELSITLSSMYVVGRATGVRPSLTVVARALLAAVCMVATLFFVRHLSLFLIVPLGAAVYLTLLILFRGLRLQDIRSLIPMR